MKSDRTKQQRAVLTVSILASFVAFLDGMIVTVALPAIAHGLSGDLSLQQWVVDGYLITLGSLILIAGSFSDLFGRKRILMIGLIGFGITSLLCAAAPNGLFLIIMRILQGAAGAFLVPSSLALIISNFSGSAQAKAIGNWTAWTSIASIIGPLLGGLLVGLYSWRLIFAINVVPIAITIWLLGALCNETRQKSKVHIDVAGAILCVVGLGGPVYALIEQARYGWKSPIILVPLIIGFVSLGTLLWHERMSRWPMLPLGLFKIRNFAVGNIATFAVYAGLSLSGFVITVFIQQVARYSALEAGLALLPVTILMFVLSPVFGKLSSRYGPRLFMGLGPLIASLGFILFLRTDHTAHYLTQLLPSVLLFGLGLSTTVAPLTEAILGAIDSHQAGVGSAINNAVARIAGLVAVAVLGVVAGTTIDVGSFHRSVLFIALLLLCGGLASAIGIENPGRTTTTEKAL